MTTRGARCAALMGALTACSQNVPLATAPTAAPTVQSPIAHVVFVVQENRSFNNLFMGYPGAATARYGRDRAGRKIRLHPQVLDSIWDIDHSSTAFFTACDGDKREPGTKCKMDGWNGEHTTQPPPKDFAYAYVPRAQVAPYWEMARRYVLADRAFASNLDGSFVAHQYVVAAAARRTVDYPTGYWGCEGGTSDTVPTLRENRSYGPTVPACFDIPTLAEEADAAGISWRFYAGYIYGDGGLWSSYQADRKIYYGADWTNDVVSPPSQFLADIANGELANVTWITPTFENSDHAGLFGKSGPAWVASLVNAIGTSRFWNSTAIFVIWDDWGGWYDPVKPVYEDYDGLGFRVPLLMISPYCKRGYVTHVQYETASVLRYIEDNFGLRPLAAADARAADPAADAFDYSRQPRAFANIAGAKPAEYWTERDRFPARFTPPRSLDGGD